MTYENNVKVSGLGSSPAEYQDSLREIARDFAALVNILAEDGYGWRSGGLPSLRAGDSLTAEERGTVVALASVRLGNNAERLSTDPLPDPYREFLSRRNWTLVNGETRGLDGFGKVAGPLRAFIRLSVPNSEGAVGSPELRIEVRPR